MRLKNLQKFIVFFLAIFAAGSISGCKETKAVDPSELQGFWILKSMNGEEGKTLFEGALPTIQFDFKEMIMSGTGGCNRYSGSFTFEKNVLSAPNLAVTKMLCVGKNEEGQFLLDLSRPHTLSVENGVLTFKNDDKKVIFEFVKGETPKSISEQLTGTWSLKLMEGNEVSNIFKFKDENGNPKYPTLIFEKEENRIGGNAGCNGYGSNYTLDGEMFIVSLPFSTQMACPNLEGEVIYLKNLADTSIISFPNENILQLSKKGDIVLEFEKIS